MTFPPRLVTFPGVRISKKSFKVKNSFLFFSLFQVWISSIRFHASFNFSSSWTSRNPANKNNFRLRLVRWIHQLWKLERMLFLGILQNMLSFDSFFSILKFRYNQLLCRVYMMLDVHGSLASKACIFVNSILAVILNVQQCLS